MFILLSLAPLTLAQGNSDAVNERIPVKEIEMEAHWGVDCASAWKTLSLAAAQHPTEDNCGVSAELARDIQLCAFIYQPPGEPPRHSCPDYQGVSHYLDQAGKPARCTSLLSSIGNMVDCNTSSP